MPLFLPTNSTSTGEARLSSKAQDRVNKVIGVERLFRERGFLASARLPRTSPAPLRDRRAWRVDEWEKKGGFLDGPVHAAMLAMAGQAGRFGTQHRQSSSGKWSGKWETWESWKSRAIRIWHIVHRKKSAIHYNTCAHNMHG